MQVLLFQWFARQLSKGNDFTGLALAEPVIFYIAGISGANFVDGSTTQVLLILVPAVEGRCAAHFKIVLLGFSQCYLTAKGNGSGPRLKHFMMQFVAGLAMLAARGFSTTSPLYGIKDTTMAAWLSSMLGVTYVTPQTACGQAGGRVGGETQSHSPDPALLCEAPTPTPQTPSRITQHTHRSTYLSRPSVTCGI